MTTQEKHPRQGIAAPTDTFRYWAFISYSSKDRDTAIWLINRIEGYRVPANLIKTPASVSPVPKRLYPLFRDRDELRAGPDLKAALDRALRTSRHLIVLCSPHSAKSSSWVNEEIRCFRQLAHGSQIIPVIVSGEPNASLHGRPELECFPPALREPVSEGDDAPDADSEPLAADLLREDENLRESRRKALLKVIARMIDVEFDDLEQRDRRRRRQRLLGGVAASFSILGLIMAALMLWYLQSIDNSAITMARETKRVVQDDPELSAIMSLRSYILHPSTAAHDGLIAVATGNPHFQSIAHRFPGIYTAALDRKDEIIAVVHCVTPPCGQHELSLIRLEHTVPLGEPVSIKADAVTTLDFHPTRDEIYATVKSNTDRDRILRFTYGNEGMGSEPEEYWSYKNQIGGIVFSADGKRSAVTFGNWEARFTLAKIKIFAEERTHLCTVELDSKIDRVAFSPNARMLAVVSDSRVQLVDIAKCAVRHLPESMMYRSSAVAFDASSALYSVGNDGALYRIDTRGAGGMGLGAPLGFSSLDYHHRLDPTANYLASREGPTIYLVDIGRYLDLKRAAREVRDTPYQYIGERELSAFKAAQLRIGDEPLLDYGFSPTGRSLYTLDRVGTLVTWRTRPYSIIEKVDPPDASWQCPDMGCEDSSGRDQRVVAEDNVRGLVANLTTSLTECGGDKKHDCVLITRISIEDKQSDLTIRTFELRDRTAPLWQRMTKLKFLDNGSLLVGNGLDVRLLHLDLDSLADRVCNMAGNLARFAETDRYLNSAIRRLNPGVGSPAALCR